MAYKFQVGKFVASGSIVGEHGISGSKGLSGSTQLQIGSIKLNGAAVTATAAQLNYVAAVPGAATASVAVVLSTNKNIAGIGAVTASSLSASFVYGDGSNLTNVASSVKANDINAGDDGSRVELRAVGTGNIQIISTGSTGVQILVNDTDTGENKGLQVSGTAGGVFLGYAEGGGDDLNLMRLSDGSVTINGALTASFVSGAKGLFEGTLEVQGKSTVAEVSSSLSGGFLNVSASKNIMAGGDLIIPKAGVLYLSGDGGQNKISCNGGNAMNITGQDEIVLGPGGSAAVRPDADLTYDFGESDKRWADVWAGTVTSSYMNVSQSSHLSNALSVIGASYFAGSIGYFSSSIKTTGSGAPDSTTTVVTGALNGSEHIVVVSGAGPFVLELPAYANGAGMSLVVKRSHKMKPTATWSNGPVVYLATTASGETIDGEITASLESAGASVNLVCHSSSMLGAGWCVY